jgi:hypothetical protein
VQKRRHYQMWRVKRAGGGYEPLAISYTVTHLQL